MIGALKVAAALVLGLALTGAMGAAVVMRTDGPAASAQGDTSGQNVGNDTLDLGFTTGPISDEELFSVDNPGTYVDAGSQWAGPDGTGPFALGLAARWGFLNDPAMAGLIGQWHLVNDSAGQFRGAWHVFNGRANGFLWGEFDFAPDGAHGRLAGKWNYSDGRQGGFLAGFWDRFDNRTAGLFGGHWTYAGGKDGGVFKGLWLAREPGKGGFKGMAIAAPTMEMVPWDGYVNVTDGKVALLREVRFEHGGDYQFGGDDKVFPQRVPNLLGWRSSTTTNWDGLIMGIRVSQPDATIEFVTKQWSKTFTARELVGLHIRVPVDRQGHEIELLGFKIPQRRPMCEGDFVKVKLTLRWGYLDEPGQAGQVLTVSDSYTPWNGFVEVTRGAVGAREVLNWERGGTYENGSADLVYPRHNPLTVEWRSSVTNDWDGLVVLMCLPLRGEPLPHVTIHTDQWTNVYSLAELRGLNETYPIRDTGEAIQVVAELL